MVDGRGTSVGGSLIMMLLGVKLSETAVSYEPGEERAREAGKEGDEGRG